MAKIKPISFDLIKIDTIQFAVISDSFREDCEIKLFPEFKVGADDKLRTVTTGFEAKFTCEGNVFIILEISCNFQLEEKSFQQLFVEKERLSLPRDFITHLMMLTIGITRGVLYEKLKATEFKDFYLPSINLKDLIKEDFLMGRIES